MKIGLENVGASTSHNPKDPRPVEGKTLLMKINKKYYCRAFI
jgi:hypothetical protein